MKTINFYFLVLFSILVPSCHEEEPVIVKEPISVPFRMESPGHTVELTFDEKIRLQKITETTGNVSVISEFFYTSDNKFKKCVTGNVTSRYTYKDNNIVRSDCYVNDTLKYYATYEFDGRNRLLHMNYWDFSENKEPFIANQFVYWYDANNNLVQRFWNIYGGTCLYPSCYLLDVLDISEFDNQLASEHLFTVDKQNPVLQFRNNNPGKEVYKMSEHNVSKTYWYDYKYNERGQVTYKAVRSTHLAINPASTPTKPISPDYETTYSYKEIVQ